MVERDDGGIEAGDAVGGGDEILGFFEGGVRGVVGGDHVEGAIQQAFQQGFVVGLRPQGRVHFVVGVEVTDVLVGEEEVVGRDLGGDFHVAARFPPADRFHAHFRGDVLDVDMGAGGVGEADVAVDDDLLGAGGGAGDAELVGGRAVVEGAGAGELRHLAVGGEEHAELRGVLHGAVEQGGVGGGVAVVGEHFHPGGAHAVDARHFLALAAFRDAAGGEDGDAGVAAAGFEHGGDGGTGIEGGGGVGHHHQAGDAAVDRGLGAGGDVFLVLTAGLAEMDVGVEKAGAEDAVLAVDHPCIAGIGEAGGYFVDDSVADQDVGGKEGGGGFGGDTGVAEEQVHAAVLNPKF